MGLISSGAIRMRSSSLTLQTIVLGCLTAWMLCASAAAQDSSQVPTIGLGPQVHTALGGFILGYDVQQDGTEGLLAESFALAGGQDNAAVETFDQRSEEHTSELQVTSASRMP